jgi:hypothetical protein
VLVEDLASEKHVFVVVLEDRIARRRRHRHRQRFQSAHGARAVGVEVIEENALANQRIEVGREVRLVPEGALVSRRTGSPR